MRAAGALRRTPLQQRLAADPLRALEPRSAEVAGRESAQSVEGQQVRRRAHQAILRGRRPQAALRELPARRFQRLRISHRHAAPAGCQGNRLHPLRAQHRADPAAARMPAVIAHRRQRAPRLPSQTDRRNAPPRPGLSPQRFVHLGSAEPEQRRRQLQPWAALVDPDDGPLRSAPGQHDRIVTGALQVVREVAGGERVGDETGLW